MARKQLTSLDFLSVSRIVNLPDGTDPQHPATVAQLNAAIEGLAWKDSVRVATQANLNLSSPGASIDGVTMAAGDRVLVRAQTSAPQNGIYIWNGAAVAMTRSLDASTFPELEQAVTSVEEGTSAGTTYRQTAVNGTIDTNDVTWTVFGTAAPDASETTKGLIEIATQPETDAGTDDVRALTATKAKNASWMLKKYAALIGDGSANQFVVTHNLNTRDVQVVVYLNSGSYEEVNCDVEHTSVNTVTVRFASAPTSNQYRVVVIG